MARKSYDQKLKKRWLKKQEKIRIRKEEKEQDLERMLKTFDSVRSLIQGG